MKKALAYVRVSSEGQAENTSLENQKNMIMAYILNYGYELAEAPFIDVDSGDKEDRQGLEGLRLRIKNKGFDAVIVAKIDRFTRDIVIGETVRKEIETNGGKLISVNESFDTSSPAGIMFLQLLQIFSQYEKTQILWRFSNGKRKTVTSRGKWIGGITPMGYTAHGTREKTANGAISVNTEEQKIIQYIFALRAEGKSIPTICKMLKEKGLKTRQRTTKRGIRVGGVDFHPAAVFRILGREKVYKGLATINSSFILEPGVIANQPKII